MCRQKLILSRTDVMILKKILPKNLAKILAFWLKLLKVLKSSFGKIAKM
jgi:hypothetical protein